MFNICHIWLSLFELGNTAASWKTLKIFTVDSKTELDQQASGSVSVSLNVYEEDTGHITQSYSYLCFYGSDIILKISVFPHKVAQLAVINEVHGHVSSSRTKLVSRT